MKLDEFDLKILHILQQNNLTPQRTIGEAVSLSAAAVQRRIKRMEDNGVIEAHRAVINPAAVNRQITLIVHITLESERTALIDEIKKSFRDAPEVQQCYYVTGEVDFILVVSTATMSEYEELTRRLFFNNTNIKRFNTFVTMDRVKTGLALLL